MKKSSLSSQTTIPKISKIDYSKDALRHEKYSKLCTDLGQCLEVSFLSLTQNLLRIFVSEYNFFHKYQPAMESRMDQCAIQSDLADIFLHFYFKGISDTTAEFLVSSLLARVKSVDPGPRKAFEILVYTVL